MSALKRSLSPEGSSSTKRRKTEPALEEEDAEGESYDRKNLLKSGSIPTGKAWRRKTLLLELYIPAIDATDAMGGVKRQLNDVLLTYVREAEGILMGWDKPRFLDDTARLLDESPFCYARVAVDTVIWRPRRGEQLEGSVKLMGPSHIGILILGTFNASIPRRLIPESWTFEENFEGDDGFWKDASGTPLEIDQELRFQTVNIKKGANIISVEGSLLDQVTMPEDERSVPADKLRQTTDQTHSGKPIPAADGKHSSSTPKADRKAEKERHRSEKKMAKAKRKSGRQDPSP